MVSCPQPVLPNSAGAGRRASRRCVEVARRFLDAGADILDVGGESTRPGSQPVDADEEKQRVLPVIQAIAGEFPDALISIDTYKAEVAEAALEAGARIINDVWGLRADPDLAAVAARARAPVILMHNRSKPASVEVRERLGKAYAGGGIRKSAGRCQTRADGFRRASPVPPASRMSASSWTPGSGSEKRSSKTWN